MLLHEPFDYHAGSRGQSVLARSMGREWTYAEGRDRSLRIASALLDLGLKPGERVATIMGNSLDVLLIVYAAARTGIVCVPLNCRLAAREWRGMIEDAEARAVIADPDFCAAFDQARPAIAICAGSPPPGWLELDHIAKSASPRVPDISLASDTPVLQLYTSGTTGTPKGAMISHASLMANIAQLSFAVGDCVPGQRSLHVLPFFHVAGVAFALRAVSGGETLVILRAADPGVVLRTLVEERIAWTFIVPTLIHMMLQQPGVRDLDFPDLRQILYGASPIAEPVLIEAMAVFRCDFLQGFGMTELSCAGTFLTEVDHRLALNGRPDLLASAGRPLPGTELRIVDQSGRDCPPGEVGEVLLRGPQVFLGYWRLPEATAAAFDNGWLRSGDAGLVDPDGYLFIRDRIKDTIVSGGENVSPAEVEAVLHRHPGVGEVSVIGVPDEKWGETVMAVIVPRQGFVLAEPELDRFCRAELGGFKLPRRYAFVEALPRNASGKILKRELRRDHWAGKSRQIG